MATIWVRRNGHGAIIGWSTTWVGDGAWNPGEGETHGDRPMSPGWTETDDTAAEFLAYQKIQADPTTRTQLDAPDYGKPT